jgi:threonine synthase
MDVVGLGNRSATAPTGAVPAFEGTRTRVTRQRRVLVHTCEGCGRVFGHGYIPRCPSCGGLVEVHYDLDSVRLYDSVITSHRFADLLPIADRTNLLSLGEGNTPCVHAGQLGEAIGLDQLYLKVESANPSGTTKDRMAAIVLSLFHELGIREFISSSTGNSSSALARGIQLYPRFVMHLFVGRAFSDRVRFSEGNPGVRVEVLDNLSFSGAFNHAKAESARRGLAFEAGFFNFARREGLKLAFFEAIDQVPSPIRWYVQAVSSAMGIYGAWKGAKELVALKMIDASPRMICVQQETCSPMVDAFEEQSPEILEHHIVPNPTGIAKAILRGNPTHCYPYVYTMVKDSGGTFTRVSESEILEAQAQLREYERIDCGYCGAATIAAIAKLAANKTIGADETVLLNLTD